MGYPYKTVRVCDRDFHGALVVIIIIEIVVIPPLLIITGTWNLSREHH